MERAKRFWLTQNNGKSLAIVCLSLAFMQGCSTPYPDADKSGGKTGSTSTTTSTTSTTSTATGDATTTTTTADGKDAKSGNAQPGDKTGGGKPDETAIASKPDAANPKANADTDKSSLLTDMPEIAAASQKVDLHTMADNMVICTVKGTAITVGDYKEEFKMRENKLQGLLSADPQLVQQLTALAASRKITLTDSERKKLIETSKKAKDASGKAMTDYLKDSKTTSQQFDDKVLDLGLALKTAAAMTRETLLNELVDQQLLILAAKDKGFYSKAFNKYIETKTAPEYKEFMSQTGLTAEQAQKQIIDRELITMYIDRLKEDNANVTEQEIKDVYDKNLAKLKHGERFRLSQIVIAAPQDSKDQPGIKQQLKQRFPSLSDKDLEAKANEFKSQQKKNADEILAKILKGAKFADMANNYTEDPANKSTQNGGDIGWKEKSMLEPDFVSKISTLKVGEVYPHVLTTRFGYHILKLEAKEEPGTTPLASVRDNIKQELQTHKQEEAIKTWIQQQHKSGTIKLSPEFTKLTAPGAQKTP